MADYKITETMYADHLRIERMLKNMSRGSIDDYRDFKRFKWELERHIFVEERAIFSMLNDKRYNQNKEIMSVLEEHDKILQHLHDKEHEMRRRGTANLAELSRMLEKHKRTEDEVIYPALDRGLNEDQRWEIISRIHREIKGMQDNSDKE